MADQSEPRSASGLAIRDARWDDYAAFRVLFPELLVDDPIPTPDVWASKFVPHTQVATDDGQVVGYCYIEELEDTGYVRNIVVAPSARRCGIGRALMSATAERLRAGGKAYWRLNVKPDNRPAIALYSRLGMQRQYLSRALVFPFSALGSIPAGNAVARRPPEDRLIELEARFGLPSGQLGVAARLKRMIFEAVTAGDEASTGLAVFDPKFPGAFPFRILETGAIAPLVAAMRAHIPSHDHVNLVIEDDENLADLLTGAGATVKGEFLHFFGKL